MRCGSSIPVDPSNDRPLDYVGMKIHACMVNGCGMGPTHPHDPIKYGHMEARLWDPKGKVNVLGNKGVTDRRRRWRPTGGGP
jgi:hypothetical protein